jgi:octaprenyl-diphosphate synthase
VPEWTVSQTLAAIVVTHYAGVRGLLTSMVLPIESAARALRRSAEDKADPKLVRRLSDLQGLLEDDLVWVETALFEATGRGERPGRDAARHLVARGGKRVRPMALVLSAACFGKVPEAAREMALVAELIHTATLLHDDVIDDGTDRRGAPTSRVLWSNAVSVLGGDLVLVEALDRTLRHAPAVLESLFSTLRQLVDGEIVQLRGRAELDVSRDTNDRILRGKTASLFRWATGTGARLGGATSAEEERFATFGELVGMAFQLVDDALDYSSVDPHKTKLADLREGKMTLPLVLAVEGAPALGALVSRIHAGDDAPLDEVRRMVLESGACDEVRALAKSHTVRALEVLSSAPACPARTLLEDVVRGLADRSG